MAYDRFCDFEIFLDYFFFFIMVYISLFPLYLPMRNIFTHPPKQHRSLTLSSICLFCFYQQWRLFSILLSLSYSIGFFSVLLEPLEGSVLFFPVYWWRFKMPFNYAIFIGMILIFLLIFIRFLKYNLPIFLNLLMTMYLILLFIRKAHALNLI